MCYLLHNLSLVLEIQPHFGARHGLLRESHSLLDESKMYRCFRMIHGLEKLSPEEVRRGAQG